MRKKSPARGRHLTTARLRPALELAVDEGPFIRAAVITRARLCLIALQERHGPQARPEGTPMAHEIA